MVYHIMCKFTWTSVEVCFPTVMNAERFLIYVLSYEEWITAATTDMISWTTNNTGSSSFHQIRRLESLAYTEANSRAENIVTVFGIKSVRFSLTWIHKYLVLILSLGPCGVNDGTKGQ